MLAVGDRMNDAVFKSCPLVICPIFMISGIAIFGRVPKKLLSWDRRTGYHIYKNKLKSTNDGARHCAQRVISISSSRAVSFSFHWSCYLLPFSVLFLVKHDTDGARALITRHQGHKGFPLTPCPLVPLCPSCEKQLVFLSRLLSLAASQPYGLTSISGCGGSCIRLKCSP